jgi:hypothetical protein
MNKLVIILVILEILLVMLFGLILYMTTHGDMNLDGKVDIIDLSIMSSNWSSK